MVEFPAQFLYRQQDNFVFMNTSTYEQYELSKEQVGDAWQFLKDGLECTLMVFDNNPLTVTPPNHVVLRVEYAEPAARGQHRHERAEAGQAGNRRRDSGAGVCEHGRLPAHRYPDGRVHRAGQSTGGVMSWTGHFRDAQRSDDESWAVEPRR